MAEFQPPEGLRKLVREAIEQACPSEDQCLADEAECFAAHPIHEFVSSEGRLEAVYANVDGLVDVVLAALFEAREVEWGWRGWSDQDPQRGMPLRDEAAAREVVAAHPGTELVCRQVGPWVPVVSDNSEKGAGDGRG